MAPTGGDDTHALQGAFDLCVAIGDGCTVRLAAGTFRTNQLVVTGFNGIFEGAGAESSVIEPFGVLTVNTNENVTAQIPSADNPWPALLFFIDANMTMRDVGYRVSLEEPTTTWHALGLDFSVLSSIVLITGDHSRVDIERVRMDSGAGAFFGANVINGIFIEGILPGPSAEWGDWLPLSGTFTVTDSRFFGPDGAVVVANLRNATLAVHGNYMEGNLPLFISDTEGSTIVASDNEIVGLFVGIYAESGIYRNQAIPSRLVFSDNDVRVAQDGFGVQLLDLSETPAYEVLISGNRFVLDNAAAGVMGQGSVGTIVRGNQFTGSAAYGFQVGAAPADPEERPPVARGWIVAVNDLTGLTVGTAEAWVTSFAADNLIVCPASLEDEGSGTIQTCR